MQEEFTVRILFDEATSEDRVVVGLKVARNTIMSSEPEETPRSQAVDANDEPAEYDPETGDTVPEEQPAAVDSSIDALAESAEDDPDTGDIVPEEQPQTEDHLDAHVEHIKGDAAVEVEEPLPPPLATVGLEPPVEQAGKSRKCAAFFVLLVVICAAIGIGVGIPVSRNNKKNQQHTADTNVDAPASNGTSQSTPDLVKVIDYLVATGVSGRADFEGGATPQLRAANWIANLDSMNMTIPTGNSSSPEGYQFLTRYTLGLLWFALKGYEWSNQFGFMSATDFCYWNSPIPQTTADGVVYLSGGVYCDSKTNFVSSIHLGKSRG